MAIIGALIGAFGTLGIVLLFIAARWQGWWPLRIVSAVLGLLLSGVALLFLEFVLHPI